MSSPTTSTAFSAVTRLEPAGGPGTFDAQVHPNWTIGGKPNGGYLLALLARAAVAVVVHEHVVAASAHYLHAPDPGPARLTTEVLRTGRSADQVRVRLAQDGRACVEALFTLGTLTGSAPYWAGGVPSAGLDADGRPGPADGMRVPGTNPAGLRVAIMDEVDLRLDTDTTGFATGRPSGRGELRGWLALPAGEAFDPVSLLYAVDAFPPATFDVELTGWVPTLELTAYVRALPGPGPVRVLHRAQLVEAGRVDEQSWVFDSTGRVVAQATQLAGIRLG